MQPNNLGGCTLYVVASCIVTVTTDDADTPRAIETLSPNLLLLTIAVDDISHRVPRYPPPLHSLLSSVATS